MTDQNISFLRDTIYSCEPPFSCYLHNKLATNMKNPSRDLIHFAMFHDLIHLFHSSFSPVPIKKRKLKKETKTKKKPPQKKKCRRLGMYVFLNNGLYTPLKFINKVSRTPSFEIYRHTQSLRLSTQFSSFFYRSYFTFMGHGDYILYHNAERYFQVNKN